MIVRTRDLLAVIIAGTKPVVLNRHAYGIYFSEISK